VHYWVVSFSSIRTILTGSCFVKNRKTTLISALTLDALYGKAIGEVTLNGVPINDKVFKSHCYVVKQHDKHWPYLTCRETLRYAAELFDVAPTKEDLELLLEEIMQKMGLTTVADSRNSAMSGGQRRRLSIGIALLKQPTLVSLLKRVFYLCFLAEWQSTISHTFIMPVHFLCT